MNFKPEPPTQAGAYWWKEMPQSVPELKQVEEYIGTQGDRYMYCQHLGVAFDLVPMKGLWSSRLVPCEERDILIRDLRAYIKCFVSHAQDCRGARECSCGLNKQHTEFEQRARSVVEGTEK